ncbi:hypothetical protein E2P81_ATG03409 [Venturia nashicola]|nr:hypothetical protein E2P81_ATG03409 [Venturia nashicola]
MKASIISSVALVALATAAPFIGRRQIPNTQVIATLQFEIAPDTFTANTDITLGTQIDTDIEVLSIGLNSAVAASCEARTQSTVVGRFTNLMSVNFDVLTQITSISCSADGATASSTAAPAPATPTASPVAPVAPVSTFPTATLTLEIMPDTFVQMTVDIGVSTDTNLNLISAIIATTDNVADPAAVKCEANDNNSSNVAGVFTIAETAVFNDGAKALISRISCSL